MIFECHITSHAEDYDSLFYRMMDTREHLLNAEVPVIRMKIEGILFDTKAIPQ